MNCQDAEKWMLLQDSGEMPAKRANELAAHLHDCEPCQRFQHALIESHEIFESEWSEPDPKSVQNVLRAARQQAPERKRRVAWGLKPVFAAAAAVLVALGLFFTAGSSDEIAMELVVTETQLLDAEDQVVSVMYEGLSEDDLAFNFLMTYEDSYASL